MDGACELLTNNSVIAIMKNNFKCYRQLYFWHFVLPKHLTSIFIHFFSVDFSVNKEWSYLVLLLGPSLNSKIYPKKYSNDLQFAVKQCKISLAAPRKWGEPITGIAQTYPVHCGTSKEKTADTHKSVTTWKNWWSDT